MSNVSACVNEAFLNHLLQPYLGFFVGTQIVNTLSLEVTYEATASPRFELAARAGSEHDFILRVPSLEVTAYRYVNRGRGQTLFNRRFALAFHGDFNLQQDENDESFIGVQIARCDVENGGLGGKLLALALNQAIIPAISRQLPRLRIPDLRALIGFDVRYDSLRTAGGLLYMLMTVPEGGNATPPPIRDESDQPAIYISATGEAVTATQRDFVIKRGIDDDSPFPLPMGINLGIAEWHIVGYMQADSLRVRVRQSEPTCSINLTAAAGMKIGLKPFGKYDLSLKPKIKPPRFSLDLQTDQTSIYAVIQMVSSPLVDWTIPGVPTVFKPILRDLLAGVDASMSIVYDAIDAGLRVIRVPLVSLDGLPFVAAIHSARFEGNSIIVRVVLT